jgi:hypothetical protein
LCSFWNGAPLFSLRATKSLTRNPRSRSRGRGPAKVPTPGPSIAWPSAAASALATSRCLSYEKLQIFVYEYL